MKLIKSCQFENDGGSRVESNGVQLSLTIKSTYNCFQSICGIIADKQYQKADWRIRLHHFPVFLAQNSNSKIPFFIIIYTNQQNIFSFHRPLPETHLRYAREDTHYLLYIYDVVRGMLREKGEEIVGEVFEKSREICMKVCACMFVFLYACLCVFLMCLYFMYFYVCIILSMINTIFIFILYL